MTTNLQCPDEFQQPVVPTIAGEAIGVCVLCGGTSFEAFASGFDYEIRTCANEWYFRRCMACGHVQLDPRPCAADLGVIYPDHYYSYSMSKKLSPIALKGKDLLDRLKLKGILRHHDLPITTYLDIGCGDGRYLHSVEKFCGIRRADIFGLELSANTVENLRQEGFSVFHERIETCREIQPGSISFATMFHVIEHVADPVATIAQVSAWLSPGGVLAIETPNINSLDARLFQRTFWGGYHFPRHWHLFHEVTLAALMRRNGMEPVHVSYQTGHSFWMYSFHHWIRYRLKQKWLSRFFDPMQGIFFLILFTGFDKLRALLGMRTSAILMVARKV